MNKFANILYDQRDELHEIDLSQLCPRNEESEINLDSNLAQIVIGMRRSGKSTLCQKVLLQSKVNFAYVNFDDERLNNVRTEDLNDILVELYGIYGNFTHLFLDEIQNVDAWPLFINRLLRMKIRIILTGSNANLLSSELITHMTGRYNLIELFPFSFHEYCFYKQIDITRPSTKAIGLRNYALNEYINVGGFPELLQNPSLSPKVYVQSLFRAIIEKDICKRYKIRYKKTIYDLANYILDAFCQEKSYTGIAKDMQVKSVHTIKNYLAYLDNAYLTCSIQRYAFKNVIRNSTRKCYAIDISFISQREHTIQTENLGWRLENIVAIELLRRMKYATQELYYLRDGRNYEVDFAVVEQGHITQLIQVTYDFTNPKIKLYNREVGGLLKGSKATHCTDLTLVMWAGEPRDIQVDGLTIHCVLATDWLLNNN